MLNNISELEILFQENKKLDKDTELLFIESEIPFFEIKDEILQNINKELELSVVPKLGEKGSDKGLFLFNDEKGEPVKTTTVIIQTKVPKEDFLTIEDGKLVRKASFYLLGHMDSYVRGVFDNKEFKNILDKTLNVINWGEESVKGLYLQKINTRIGFTEDRKERVFEFIFSFTKG